MFEVIMVTNMEIVALYPEDGNSRFPETLVPFYQTTSFISQDTEIFRQRVFMEYLKALERLRKGSFRMNGVSNMQPLRCVTANAKTQLLSIVAVILRCCQQRRVIT
jgi:hypothetical protein